ncbi:hypothetical protein EVA_01864 [gut metagenome]|uniref:Uncharacterized protein n=1 Tax=gut metagenome TaxID=749906 RepID=J9GQF7_9ZZZZ
MTQLKVGTHILTAQIEVTILHAEIVTAVRIRLDGKGRSQ